MPAGGVRLGARSPTFHHCRPRSCGSSRSSSPAFGSTAQHHKARSQPAAGATCWRRTSPAAESIILACAPRCGAAHGLFPSCPWAQTPVNGLRSGRADAPRSSIAQARPSGEHISAFRQAIFSKFSTGTPPYRSTGRAVQRLKRADDGAKLMADDSLLRPGVLQPANQPLSRIARGICRCQQQPHSRLAGTASRRPVAHAWPLPPCWSCSGRSFRFRRPCG